MSLLRLVDVSRNFGGIVAVDDLNLVIDDGQMHCLIGPNGAGKSTVFKLITGLTRLSAGAIHLRDRNISRLQPYHRARLGVAMKYQATRIFSNLSVGQNIHIAQRKARDRNSELEWGLNRLGLADRVTWPASALSYGQQHWLEICMTLANAPQVVLMDEPTAGMTPEETLSTAHFLKELNERGTTVVVVEHDMGFIREIGGHVTVLHQGRVFKQGTIGEMESDPDVQRIYLGEQS